MAQAKYPAVYEHNVTTANADIGDLALFFSSDGGISGVNGSLIEDHKGYDGGRLQIFVIEQQGSLTLSEAGDVVHTGHEDAIEVSASSYKAEQGGGEGVTLASNLTRGDVIIIWDEDPHGGTKGDWSYSGNRRSIAYDQSQGGVYYQVMQASSPGDAVKTDDNYVEHNAIKLSLTIVPSPTNLVAEGTNVNTIELSWDCTTDPSQFSIERKRAEGRQNYEFIATVDGANRTFTDNTVSSDVPYVYRVWASKPAPSDFTLDTTSEDVRIGDLIVMYENGSVSGVSNNTIINDLGLDGGQLKVFLVEEDGTANISANGEPEIIHIGHDNIDEISSYSVKISSEDSSIGAFKTLSSGDIIIQWDESSEGSDSGYYSFTGNERLLYEEQGANAYRRVSQVFDLGDISRDVSSGVELSTISLDVSPGSVLLDTMADPTNKAEARTQMTNIDVR